MDNVKECTSCICYICGNGDCMTQSCKGIPSDAPVEVDRCYTASCEGFIQKEDVDE